MPDLQAAVPLLSYCIKCRENRNMKDPEIMTSDSGRRMAKGKCPVCDGKVFRILR